MERYVAVDLETTGLYPGRDRILEIGAVKVRDGMEVETFHTLVDPRMEIPENITDLTGITGEMVTGKPTADRAVAEFAEFAAGYPLLGHSLQFDYAFLKHQAADMGLHFEKLGCDSLKIARLLLPQLPSRRLGDLCAHFGIGLERAHRALEDARAAGEVFERLKRDFGEKNPEYFEEKPLICRVKKRSPITPRQKVYLHDLLKYHKITVAVEIDSLTRNEASRLIDRIILEHGRMEAKK
ncbi:MAG TPA: 3'-5' exoribonuclease [Candidatus Egerieimonas intestinavium]|uniref:3'-5' exoribonuclease n=1 Tax=Candidatus Egerieimonas intestinavium TaxID=2840777 RepID=A0A9D1EI88_9FIRM|nr:3'-5' exoribonuclease [Candidatus Egerieimonas intestinavium]